MVKCKCVKIKVEKILSMAYYTHKTILSNKNVYAEPTLKIIGYAKNAC